jgi:hypothetical protein
MPRVLIEPSVLLFGHNIFTSMQFQQSLANSHLPCSFSLRKVFFWPFALNTELSSWESSSWSCHFWSPFSFDKCSPFDKLPLLPQPQLWFLPSAFSEAVAHAPEKHTEPNNRMHVGLTLCVIVTGKSCFMWFVRFSSLQWQASLVTSGNGSYHGNENLHDSWEWWCTRVLTALGRLEQEDREFEVSLGNTASSRPPWAMSCF